MSIVTDHPVHPKVAELIRITNELAGPDRLPVRSRMQLDFMRLSTLLDHVFLVEVIDGGRDYYFKYSGDLMPAAAGANLCGRCVSDIEDASARQSLKETYDCVVEERAPLYLSGHYVWPQSRVPIERILVPLLDEAGAVSAICGLAVAGVSDEELVTLAGEGPAAVTGSAEVLATA